MTEAEREPSDKVCQIADACVKFLFPKKQERREGNTQPENNMHCWTVIKTQLFRFLDNQLFNKRRLHFF